MARWKQFCFTDGEAIREEGGAGRIGIRPSPPDKAGARQRETLRAGRIRAKSFGLRTWPYHRYDRAEALDLDPNSLRQNDSI
jgi:hypothetical protein